MLEGNELDEPMTLTCGYTLYAARYDGARRERRRAGSGTVDDASCFERAGIPVCLYGGNGRRILPHQSSIDEDNIEEERRLAYVGITRAQKELTFTLCKERRQYGELVRPEPSRFLLELPQDDLIWEQERKVVSAEERMQKGKVTANLKAMMAAKRAKS